MPAADLDNPICVALDFPSGAQVRSAAEKLADHVGVFKIGLTTFVGNGSGIVRELAAMRPVFLDLKLHDIPMQVGGAVEMVAATGAAYTTVHASGSTDMVRAAVDASGDTTVLAVTILTSLDGAALEVMGFPSSPAEMVLRLADVALGAGAPGLVCSPKEVPAIRARFGARSAGGPLLVVPGIRSTGAGGDDQRRTLSAREALDAGADVIVVGRPITAAPDPVVAATAIHREIG